jgi:small subunit ribosomal protein S2
MIGDKSIASEYADVTPVATESHFIGLEDEEAQESNPIATTAVEQVEEETVDLNAALGGGIKKQPASDTETEAEPVAAEAGA